MKRERLPILAAVLTAGFLSMSLPKSLFAQAVPEQPPNRGQQATPGQPANVDDQQLRSFAKVYVQVEKIRQTYEPRAKQASPEEGKQIQQEAQSKFHEALTKEGLTEDSYTQIFEVARADQAVRKKVLQMIGEERGKS